MSVELKAYIKYCDWCAFLDLLPADLETWKKTTAKISEVGYS